MSKFFLLFVLLFVSIFTFSLTELSDTTKDLETAKNEGKDILYFFEGSDWCPYCKNIERSVLTNQSFLTKIDDDFILVRVDSPKINRQSLEIKKKNARLARKYNIVGMPVFVLADENGNPYSKQFYQESSFASTINSSNYSDLFLEIKAQKDKLVSQNLPSYQLLSKYAELSKQYEKGRERTKFLLLNDE